jgi:hypothetical protein
MINRLLVRTTIVAVAVMAAMAGLPTVAGATVLSAEIERVVIPDGLPYAPRRSTELYMKPLKVQAVKGNPTVTFRTYIADGDERDPGRFRLLAVRQIVFAHYEIMGGVLQGWRLDTSKIYLPFYETLQTVSSGVHSVYVTADDGTGECPPSNIVTFELMPDPNDVFQAPVISNIRSPEPGVVVFNVDPVVYSGRGDPPRILSVYRSDGRVLDYDLAAPIGNIFGPYRLHDSASIGSKLMNEVVIVGLKKGEASFHVRLYLESGTWAKGIASNVLTVDVAGTATAERGLSAFINQIVTLGVGRDAAAGAGYLYPNPADRIVHLHVPFDGAAAAAVYDALGRRVWEREVYLAGGFAALDVSELRAGRYVASIESGHRVERLRFVVVR